MVEQVSSLSTGVKYKDTPIGKIPVDWEVVPLSKISGINMGQSPSSQDCNEEKDGLPYYQGNAEFGSKYPSPKKWCKRPKKTAEQGNILINVRAPVGDINIAPHKCCIGRGIAAVRTKDAYDNFLYHSILLHRKALSKICQESTFEAINRKGLTELLISLPPLLEQKKIAEILTTIDSAIEKTTQIIDKTKELKKGVMQRLLTRGIGHTRFKKTEIGEIPLDWEVVKLRDIVKKFYNGGTPDTTNREYWDRHIPWVTGADFEIQGTSINGLLRGDLESFLIPLPPVKEQKKIAKILSSIDDELEKESNHRDQLILLKNGLVQVLLTGKLRVA